MQVELFLIDPQVDFCDPDKGALYVPGAEKDIERIADLVRRIGPDLTGIQVSLDSHHTVHIAHPIFWIDADGNHPAPFTPISAAEVESGRWRTSRPDMISRALEYVRSLERNGRYSLFIWPYHCLIGSRGHAVMSPLFEALTSWEQRFAVVDYINKGSNLWTEHYSALVADVPDPTDPTTFLNKGLISRLERADLVLIAGEASSHCVANTVRDLLNNLGEGYLPSRFVLLTDGISPVKGFEEYHSELLEEVTARGVRLETAASISL